MAMFSRCIADKTVRALKKSFQPVLSGWPGRWKGKAGSGGRKDPSWIALSLPG